MAVGKIMSNKEKNNIGLIVYDLFVILVSILIVYYINRLEKLNCHCSYNKKRDFIKYYSIALISYIITTMFYPQFKNDLVQFIVVMFSIINMITLYTYIRDIRTCKCAMDTDQDIYIYEFITYYSRYLVLFGMYAILVIIAMYVTTLKLPKYIKNK